MTDKLPPKAELLKEWHERKGDEPWTLEEIAELIADAYWLAEERIVGMLETLKGDEKACCDDCQPHLDIHRQYLTVVIDMIQGENN